MPLYIAAPSLDTYDLTLFLTGPISVKGRASTCIPMLFKPKKIGKANYIDGAVVKERLPQALLDVEPDLDLIIVSNFQPRTRLSGRELSGEREAPHPRDRPPRVRHAREPGLAGTNRQDKDHSLEAELEDPRGHLSSERSGRHSRVREGQRVCEVPLNRRTEEI